MATDMSLIVDKSRINFTKSKQKLESLLSTSAFRQGTSAFRYGLIQQGISDHLPIIVNSKIDERDLKIISWNLLSDDHLYNNLMNVTGSSLIIELLASDPLQIYGGTPQQNRLYYFFSELAQFLCENCKQDIIITKELLDRFIDEQPSLLARSRNSETAASNRAAVINDRKKIILLFLMTDHENVNEFKLAIKHSVEMIYNIKYGCLKWENRYQLLKESNLMINVLKQADVLCLQECTNPTDINNLLNKEQLKYNCISHRINDRSNDYCVIFYNTERFEMIGEPLFYAIEGKKPCIVVKLDEKDTGKQIIISSIHHPGGAQNYLPEILQKTDILQPKEAGHKLPFYVLGDFNHTKDYFTSDAFKLSGNNIIYPNYATMAGSDYGNINQAIDAVLTNAESSMLSVMRLENQHSRPVPSNDAKVQFSPTRELVSRLYLTPTSCRADDHAHAHAHADVKPIAIKVC